MAAGGPTFGAALSVRCECLQILDDSQENLKKDEGVLRIDCGWNRLRMAKIVSLSPDQIICRREGYVESIRQSLTAHLRRQGIIAFDQPAVPLLNDVG